MDIEEALRAIPAADVAPVVQCRDCKLDDADTRKRVDKDIHPVPKGGSTKW